jgi:hypothetical protein
MLYQLSKATSITVLQQSFSFQVMLAISLFKSSFCMWFWQRHLKATDSLEEKWVKQKGSAIANSGPN